MKKYCERCSTADRYKRGGCKACARERARQWAINNPKLKKEANRVWAINNPEKVKRANLNWRENNKERERKVGRERYKRNSKKYNIVSRKWKEANPENRAKNERLRRARKVKAICMPYSFEEICNNYGNICLCCKRDNMKLTADHVIPLSKNGSDVADNIQPLCGVCNTSKYTRIIDHRPDKQNIIILI